jgi:GxxExxY protein
VDQEEPMPELLYRELTGRTLRAYYTVYNGTSRTYPEYIYENGMVRLMGKMRVRYRRQPEYRIMYKEQLVGVQRLDILLVDEKVVVECKVAPKLERRHKAQTFSYMKTVGARVGLLLNFGGPKPEFERLYFDPERRAEYESGFRPLDELPDGLLYPETTGEVLGTAVEVHRTLGPGFIRRIYAHACAYEYELRGVGAELRKEYHVIFQGESIGSFKFNHFVVEGEVMHFPVTVRDAADMNVHNLKDWMRHQGIRLGVLTNFYDTAIRPVFVRD